MEQADTPDHELWGPLERAGLLNEEPMGPQWRPWVTGPLEQAGGPLPDKKAMEHYSWGI